jgi:hypothetical protein
MRDVVIVKRSGASKSRMPWAVRCPSHNRVCLTHDEHVRQSDLPALVCPLCGKEATWDQEWYEQYVKEMKRQL